MIFVYTNPDRVELILLSILDLSCKRESRFQTGIKRGNWKEIDVYCIMAKIKIACKMWSFIHVLKYTSAKIVKTIREQVHESETCSN